MNPAQPAQPIKPALPNTGGYQGPTPGTPRVEPIQTQPLPAPGLPVGGSPTPPSAPPPQGAPGPMGLGISPEQHQEILGQFQDSPDQQAFQKNFQTLAEQRSLLGGPASFDSRGLAQPDENMSDYFQAWVKKSIAYQSAPETAGGMGRTLPQARMMAIAEARRRWPNYDPTIFAKYAGTQQQIANLTAQVDPDGGGAVEGAKYAPMEFGPVRASKLDHSKIAETLNYKRFDIGNKWAQEYKESAGTGANATEFAKYIITQQAAKGMKGTEQTKSALAAGQDWLAKAKAVKKVLDANPVPDEQVTALLTELQTDPATLEEKIAKAELGLVQAKKANPEKTAAAVLAEARDYFVENIDTFSVVAALNQLF